MAKKAKNDFFFRSSGRQCFLGPRWHLSQVLSQVKGKKVLKVRVKTNFLNGTWITTKFLSLAFSSQQNSNHSALRSQRNSNHLALRSLFRKFFILSRITRVEVFCSNVMELVLQGNRHRIEHQINQIDLFGTDSFIFLQKNFSFGTWNT